jgi:sugar phosphate isomerase/epimerase
MSTHDEMITRDDIISHDEMIKHDDPDVIAARAQSLVIGCVTDEVSVDLARAVDLLRRWDVHHVELRMLSSGRVPVITERELALLRELTARGELVVTALSPGLGKLPIGEAAAIARERTELLPRTLDLAGSLGISTLIHFGYAQREDPREGDRDRAAEHLHRAAERAAEAGVRLAIENEHGFVCDGGTATADVLRRAEHVALGVQWDPANALGARVDGREEDPVTEGYAAVRALVAGVHVKDARTVVPDGCVPVGEGRVDWPAQLAALVADGVCGQVTIETHCTPLEEMTERNIRTVRGMLARIAAGEGA